MHRMPPDVLMNKQDMLLVDAEIQAMLVKGAILRVLPCQDQFLSNIFLVPKKSGGMRPIINLKKLNEFIHAPHFKMEHLLSFLPCIRQGMYMTSLDLSDAYFTLPVDKDFRKYLRFQWKGVLYEFQCLCFGLSSAPYIFTKVMKPVFTSLRKDGILSSYYIDDSIYANSNAHMLSSQTLQAKQLLESLGCIVNEKKSSMVPSTSIKHLGFIIDSIQMKVFLPQDKVDRLVRVCRNLLSKSSIILRQLAEAIGLFVSSFLAILHGQLHYRSSEMFKIALLKANPSYDQTVHLPAKVKLELEWWCDNVHQNNGRPIANILGLDKCQDDIFTDASKTGWGAALVRNGKVVQECAGRWSDDEAALHINVLELTAIQFGLQSLRPWLSHEVCINCDNTVAISYINKYGGCHNEDLNDLSKAIWEWCIERDITIKAVHIPGRLNTRADSLSRDFNDNVEWSLDPVVFEELCQTSGVPEVDLFASRLNHKLPVYFSWHPDPGSSGINSFNMSWKGLYAYAFPPFNLIGRVLSKMELDFASILLICPYWPSQPWFPQVCSLLIDYPILLPPSRCLLRCPLRDNVTHPLLPAMKLVACRLSADPSLRRAFRQRLRQSSKQAGRAPRLHHTVPSSSGGQNFVVDEELISARPLSRM